MSWVKLRPLLLISILAFAFFTRVWRLNLPSEYIFDEVYHVVTAKLISQNDQRAFEWTAPAPEPDTAIDWLHPPMAKYAQAFFIKILGANSFAWRLSSALFGLGVIYLTYLLARELFNEQVALLASFLASLDGLLLVMSRIAMNDIQVTFFILLSLFLYLKYKNNFSFKNLCFLGVSLGLSVASKWSGVFAIILILLFEFKNLLKLKYLFALIFLPFIVYFLSYWQMFLQGKNLNYFISLHKQIFAYQFHLQAQHSYQSRPIQWFLNLRPVWIWVSYNQNSRADIYAFGNPILFWAGGVSVLASLINLIKKFLNKRTKFFKSNFSLIFLLSAYFIVWLPWQFSPRIMFFYHYTPAVPLLAIILSNFLFKLWEQKKANNFIKALIILVIFLIFLSFIIFYPHLVGIYMPKSFVENIYFYFSSWR